MPKCNHQWCYEHSVYAGPRGSTLVRRFCSKCGTERVGRVSHWREPLPDEFDESAVDAAEAAEDSG